MKIKNNFIVLTILVLLCSILLLWRSKQNNHLNQEISHRESTDIPDIKVIERTIEKMIKYNNDLFNKVKYLSEMDEKMFFFYSENECTTCIDNALADYFELAKNIGKTHKLIVISPEKDKIKNDLLYKRYDGYLNIIFGDQDIWDAHALEVENNLTLFFTVAPSLKIKNTYVFKVHTEEENKKYFTHLKNRFNDNL